MSQTLSAASLIAVPLAPLAGSLLAGILGTAFGGNRIGRVASHTATILGVLFLNEAWPQGGALLGGVMIILGIILFAWVAARSHLNDPREVQAMRTEQSR